MRHVNTLFLFLAILSAPVWALDVSIATSVPSPQPVASMITWTASTSDTSAGPFVYRFRARRVGSDYHVIVDYGPNNTLDWTATEVEGSYEMEVAVRNVATGERGVGTSSFEMQSRVTGDQPVISPTSHPMVFLYSAPPCAPGSRMRVQFQDPAGYTQNTPYRSCRTGLSMNFYLAGLRGETTYSVMHTVDTGSSFFQGPALSLTTPAARTDLTPQYVLQPAPASEGQPVLLQATVFTTSFASDLNGNLLWYYPGNLTFLTRPVRGGYFWGLLEDTSTDQSHQVVREFDLVGMTVRETNAARVNEQLIAMGKRQIDGFHHEARTLPDGKILALAGVEQIMSGVQGPGPVDILGNMIIVMDSDLQVVWTWDTFDHLDVTRMATLHDMCVSNNAGNCPPLYLASNANDWVHGNSVQQTPDGNLLYSARSQDWVIKIDYQNGNGGGDVIWRLGLDGDFQINSTDPYPWFSHQHDPQLLADNSTMILLDNGNVRWVADNNINSRGQVIQLDEQNRVANLILNVDLGNYSFALGAAEKLSDGNYHFDNGYLSDATSVSMEVDSAGNTVYAVQAAAPVYRSFRMRDLYTLPGQ